MTTVQTQESLRQSIAKAGRPLLCKELMKMIKAPKEDRREIKKLLQAMVRSGQIFRVQGNRFGIPRKKELVAGRFKGHREGYGFVLPDSEGEADIYISEGKRNEAMHGDQVLATIEKTKSDGKREGRIIQILERAHRQIVGRFEPRRKDGFVVPSDKRIVQDIYIPAGNTSTAGERDIVLCEILNYSTKGRLSDGKIVRIIGRSEDPGIDSELVIASHQLPRHFSPEVMAESEKIAYSVSQEMLQGRADLRSLPTVTIDGEKARDFDDAISIKEEENVHRLWVHIADVAAYVPEGGALDEEAFKRGTSVYFPDRVLPMFPERLSNGICSLKPGEDRLCLTVEMDFDASGQRSGYRIYESVIQSKARMTYTLVRQICEEKPSTNRELSADLIPSFKSMERLALALRKRRLERGSLDFDLPESEIVLSLTGETIDIIREERNIAHRIIEEFMLMANETVAEYLTMRGIPMLYRIHEPPSSDRIEALNELIRPFKLRKVGSGKGLTSKSLAAVLEEVKDRVEESLVHQVILRTMQQARYSDENRGHFGLASDNYTHFTSPIRRYPDLVVHRLLKGVLKLTMTETEKEKWLERLPEIARKTSDRERVSVEAEREVIQRKKVQFMFDKLGKRYQGMITGVASYGLFVTLEKYLVEGLIHVTELHDDHYLYEEKQHLLLGMRHHRTYRLGQIIQVVVAAVDIENWRIDLRIAQSKKN